MHIQVQCAPEFHNDFIFLFIILFFKNNFTRINPCKFIHHKSHLKPIIRHLPCLMCREYFSIIFNVKKCALYLIKYNSQTYRKLYNIVCKSFFVRCLTIIYSRDYYRSVVSQCVRNCQSISPWSNIWVSQRALFQWTNSKKKFMAKAPGPNVIDLFTAVFTNDFNKLECLALAGLSGLV